MKRLEDNRRAVRLLGLLEGKRAAVVPAAGGGAMLLAFAGERTVKCDAGDLEALKAAGVARAVTDDGENYLSITDTGRALLRRARAGTVRGQHEMPRQAEVEMPGGRQAVTVNDAESPLTALARLRRPDGAPWLDKAEVAAGERLRADFERAMLQPRLTAQWDPSVVAGRGGSGCNGVRDLCDAALSARERVHEATDAVGPELSGAMLDICCFLKGLEQVERERGWPRRSAKLLVKIALAILDRHYHPPAAGQGTRGRIRHWGADGFRPQLSR